MGWLRNKIARMQDPPRTREEEAAREYVRPNLELYTIPGSPSKEQSEVWVEIGPTQVEVKAERKQEMHRLEMGVPTVQPILLAGMKVGWKSPEATTESCRRDYVFERGIRGDWHNSIWREGWHFRWVRYPQAAAIGVLYTRVWEQEKRRVSEERAVVLCAHRDDGKPALIMEREKNRERGDPSRDILFNYFLAYCVTRYGEDAERDRQLGRDFLKATESEPIVRDPNPGWCNDVRQKLKDEYEEKKRQGK